MYCSKPAGLRRRHMWDNAAHSTLTPGGEAARGWRCVAHVPHGVHGRGHAPEYRAMLHTHRVCGSLLAILAADTNSFCFQPTYPPGVA